VLSQHGVRLKVGLVAQQGLDEVKASVEILDRRILHAQRELGERLHKHPALRARLEALLDMVEDESGLFERADDAEEFLISQLRSLGQELLQQWASNEQQLVEQH
jgi:hypothetical protein